MKKYSAIILACSLAVGLTSSIQAEAKPTTVKIKRFKNCTALNRVYKGGVARSAHVRNKGGKTHYKPFVSKALYDANRRSDRDKDYIACER
nr:excalibur calcium-binding domain-containing protein [Fictibacillus macauensis]